MHRKCSKNQSKGHTPFTFYLFKIEIKHKDIFVILNLVFFFFFEGQFGLGQQPNELKGQWAKVSLKNIGGYLLINIT